MTKENPADTISIAWHIDDVKEERPDSTLIRARVNRKRRCFNYETDMTKKEKAVEGNEKIAALLNRIMEYELAGVVRYTHYSLMVFGYNRLPIISWLSGQADESLAHAHKAGEMITHIGGHPSLQIGPLLETQRR